MNKNPQLTTIVFPLESECVWLGMKKNGFGAGWWNGFGGKLKTGETFNECAVRETREEAEIEASNLQLIARLLFHFDGSLEVASEAFTTRSFVGKPTESSEMRPQKFHRDEIPYETMWPADRLWVPEALAQPAGKIIAYSVFFSKNKEFLSLELANPEILEEVFNQL